MRTNELELFISRVERGITDTRDAEWFRQWLTRQPGYRMDIATTILVGAAIVSLLILGVMK